MATIKMNPATLTRTLHQFDPFQQLVNDFLGRDMAELSRAPFAERPLQWPAVNVQEAAQGYTLEVVAPGLSRDDFQLALDKNVLTIAYEKQTDKTEATEEPKADSQPQYLRREYVHRSFKRAFTLPAAVDMEGIDATYNDGILRIVLPKKAEEAPKRIAIRS